MFLFFFSSRRRHTIFKCDWSSDVCSSDLFAGHPGEWISVCLGAGGAGCENGGDDGDGYSPADGTGVGKREGDTGGGGFEYASGGEDHGFPEGHERLCTDERSVCQVFLVCAAGEDDSAGGAFARGRAGRNRSDRGTLNRVGGKMPGTSGALFFL